ncbi:hypothetical protein FNV43_RR15019 [Rhamnella rubrinervis]|uniref:Uncharacterized protein n=1 Tax=Rhamnella rubrinervis TaxID=2594499 RepID=A0A8K0E833_9ROSA|nr:hypothetical protein FNV43_RR15019 [Rhamnella rubrinervis]
MDGILKKIKGHFGHLTYRDVDGIFKIIGGIFIIFTRGVELNILEIRGMPRFTRNVYPEPEGSSGDVTGHLLEALERLVAQNVQQQQPQPQQLPQSAGINTMVKQFCDLHPPKFDGSSNLLVAEN